MIGRPSRPGVLLEGALPERFKTGVLKNNRAGHPRRGLEEQLLRPVGELSSFASCRGTTSARSRERPASTVPLNKW